MIDLYKKEMASNKNHENEHSIESVFRLETRESR